MKTLRTKTDGTYNTEVDNVEPLMVIDHLNGFDMQFDCQVLTEIHDQTTHTRPLHSEYIVRSNIKKRYPKLNFTFDINSWFYENGIKNIQTFDDSYKKDFLNFACTFNNNPHVSRKLLTCAMHHYGMFNTNFSSKTFTIQPYEVIGALYDFVGTKTDLYKKFFVRDTETDFYGTRYQIGGLVSADHGRNQQHLRPLIDRSFVHIVSETMATSYYPFVTEKFLYSVAQKGLFLTWGQPEWHRYVSYYYGFKKFSKLFSYRFDEIRNPVERLISLLDMVLKFKNMPKEEWNELYTMERETIEFNYDHFKSGRYLAHLHSRASKHHLVTPFNDDVLKFIK